MKRILTGQESADTGYAVGVLLEFTSKLLSGDSTYLNDEALAKVAEAEAYLTKNFSPEEQIELFTKAAFEMGAN